MERIGKQSDPVFLLRQATPTQGWQTTLSSAAGRDADYDIEVEYASHSKEKAERESTKITVTPKNVWDWHYLGISSLAKIRGSPVPI